MPCRPSRCCPIYGIGHPPMLRAGYVESEHSGSLPALSPPVAIGRCNQSGDWFFSHSWYGMSLSRREIPWQRRSEIIAGIPCPLPWGSGHQRPARGPGPDSGPRRVKMFRWSPSPHHLCNSSQIVCSNFFVIFIFIFYLFCLASP